MIARRNHSGKHLSAVILLGCVLLVLGDTEQHDTLAQLEWTDRIRSSFHRLPQLVIANIKNTSEHIREQSTHITTIGNLKRALLVAQHELSVIDGLRDENARLRTLLNTPLREPAQKVMVASVYGHFRDVNHHRVFIDRGADEGVFIGQAVVDNYGIVGQVSAVYHDHARVLLITDSSHAIPIKVSRTGHASIAQGQSDYQELKVRHITRTTDIRLGDVLLASGLGERFPADVPVATVTNVDPDSDDIFLTVHARPVAAMQSLSMVLLLWLP